MEQNVTGIKAQKTYRFSDWPILGSQVKRIGLARATVGGLSMYFSIPFFIFFHVVGIAFLLQRIITPLLGLPQISTRDYIIIDRHRIEGLPWFDKLNCVFCGWANGISHLINEMLGHINEFDGEISAAKKCVIFIIAVMLTPVFLLVEFFGIEMIYGILISRSLGMDRKSPVEIRKRLKKIDYASNFGPIAATALFHQKVFALRLQAALEQIESSWCPLKHLDRRDEARYPEHHKNFFEPDQIEEMKKVLQTEGTVSDIKPNR